MFFDYLILCFEGLCLRWFFVWFCLRCLFSFVFNFINNIFWLWDWKIVWIFFRNIIFFELLKLIIIVKIIFWLVLVNVLKNLKWIDFVRVILFGDYGMKCKIKFIELWLWNKVMFVCFVIFWLIVIFLEVCVLMIIIFIFFVFFICFVVN